MASCSVVARSGEESRAKDLENQRIVSVGLLTESDLALLGQGFTRHFPVTDDGLFDDLLVQLDRVEVEPLGKGVVLRTQSVRQP